MTARRFPPLWFIGHGALCKTMTTTPIMQAIRNTDGDVISKDHNALTCRPRRHASVTARMVPSFLPPSTCKRQGLIQSFQLLDDAISDMPARHFSPPWSIQWVTSKEPKFFQGT